MTVKELKELLSEFGDHLPVVITIYKDGDEHVANQLEVTTFSMNMETYVSVEGDWEDDG
jgi:hypothetical protein